MHLDPAFRDQIDDVPTRIARGGSEGHSFNVLSPEAVFVQSQKNLFRRTLTFKSSPSLHLEFAVTGTRHLDHRFVLHLQDRKLP